jgi:antitoxin MazE
MKTKIQKWGNSLAVRIPSAFARETRLDCGASVQLSVEKGAIVITPQGENEYDLEQLLKGVKKTNIHDEIDSGESV